MKNFILNFNDFMNFNNFTNFNNVLNKYYFADEEKL